MNVFERVCHLLNVEIIKAYSPQAKGRVERNHGIYQDRFVKELKLKNITTIAEANDFLRKSYLAQINKKFAKKPDSSEDAHCSPKAYGDLDQIFCWEYHRQIRNDFTVRFNNEFYQLSRKEEVRLRTKQTIVVHVHLDGKVSLWKEGNRLDYEKLKEPRIKEAQISKGQITSGERSLISKSNKHKSPWSQFNPGWFKKSRRSRQNSAITQGEEGHFNFGLTHRQIRVENIPLGVILMKGAVYAHF